MALETYFLDLIEGNRSCPPLKFLMALLSPVYGLAVKLRHWAYDLKILKSFRPSAPVVSVGNIVAGGVGKTPLVKKLAEALSKRRKVAILTRGYRSQIEKGGRTLLWKGESAAVCGDEPFWLASQLPQVSVWIGRKRTESAKLACEQGAELLLLDDGMQHRQLQRDAEIVVMDAQDLWGKGHFLPRGLLRDFPSRISEARLIVLTQVKDVSEVKILQRALRRYSSAPIVGMRFEVDADLRGKKVGALCAIAKPKRFFKTLKGLGATVVDQLCAPDHTTFSKEQIAAFAQRSKQAGAELIVCTEKDHVKFPPSLEVSLPIAALKGNLKILIGQEHWDQLIEELSHVRRS